MVLSPNSMAQPPYQQQDQMGQQDKSNPLSGTYFALFALVLPARVVYDRTAASVGAAHLYRGLLATLRGGVSDLINGYRQLWREDGLMMFTKWIGLGFGVGVGTYVGGEAVRLLFDRVFDVTEEDTQQRRQNWFTSKVLSVASTGVLLYPLTVLWSYYATNQMPSWPVYLRDKVLKGKDHFYAAAPLSSLSFTLFFLTDVMRAKLLHWAKKTFFPDLLCDSGPQLADDEAVLYDREPVRPRSLVGGLHRPLLFQLANCSLYAVMAFLETLVTCPVDALNVRMIAHPLRYGPLGILGTIKSIYREEGVWGFFKGFIPDMLFILFMNYGGIEEEADTGYTPL